MTTVDGAWVQAALDTELGRAALPAGPDAAALHDALAGATLGGKRFRPLLLASVHDLLGGDPEDPALPPVAAAVELLHTAFVVHDDVIDGDETRRGRPSAPGDFRTRALAAGVRPEQATAYAVAGAVLTGDLALVAALRAVASAPAPRTTVLRLLDLLDEALQVSAAGELADVRLAVAGAEPSLDDVLSMAERKTAAYSFALPMQAGAVLAGADDAVVAGLGEVGRRLGLGYQLLDDVRGVFGDPTTTGKSELGDLREGKRTPLVVHARTTAGWAVVRRHLGDAALTPADAASVRRALEEHGSRAFVEDLAADYREEALAHARDLDLPEPLLIRIGEVSELLLGPPSGPASEGAA